MQIHFVRCSEAISADYDDERIKMGVCYAQTPKKLKAKISGSFVSVSFLK
jgi:hypothetical protein